MRKILLAFALVTHFSFIYASNFTPGNIVVVRVGDGSAALSNVSTAVFLDEYTPTGTLVQSIPAPTAPSGSNHALTLSGIATSEGSLALSANGQYLSMAGYDTTVGYAGVATGVTNRTIARIGSSGVFNTSTGFIAGSAYVAGNMRSAVTNDGNEFWTAGSGTTTGGVWYLPFGSFTTTGVQTSTTLTSVRTVNIFNGQLYLSTSGSGGTGIFTDSTGLPTTSGQNETLLPGLPSTNPLQSPFAFIMMHESGGGAGMNVMYVADDNTTSPTGGLYKFSLVSGSWVPNGNIPNVNGIRGLTGYNICSGTQLYITAVTGVYTLFDSSGYNQTITGSFNQIVTPAVNTVFKGVAFTPGTVTPTSPVASVSLANNVSCHGANNGSINISVAGGVNPLSFRWSDGPTTQNRAGLAPATYTVTVTDHNGCTSSVSDTITQPTAVSLSVTSKSNVTCYGSNNGTVHLAAAGGTIPYHYQWTGGDTSQIRTGLAAANYTVTVTDHNGCTTTTLATITQPNQILITIDSVTNLPCTGGSTGAVTISVTGGTGAYNYLWSNNAHTQNISGLTANTYRITVTDSIGCTGVDSAIVSQSGSLALSDSVRGVTCFGLSNGAITLTVSGGTPAYSYHWNNSDSTAGISGLSSGSYTVTISDRSGCMLVRPISVPGPSAALSISITPTDLLCYGLSDGAAVAAVSGGTANYSYHWSGTSATTANITNLASGTYRLTVTDHNGCIDTSHVVIIQPDSLSLILAAVNVTSHGGNDGSINMSVTGGTPGYHYLWSDAATTQNLSALTAADYCVTVTDQNGCRDSNCVAVTQPTGISGLEFVNQFNVSVSSGYININLLTSQEIQMTAELYDMTGQLIYKSAKEFGSAFDFKFSDATISSGCYIVRVITERGTLSRKIMMIR